MFVKCLNGKSRMKGVLKCVEKQLQNAAVKINCVL